MKKLVVMVSLYEAGNWIENRLDNLCHINNLAETEIWCVNANSPDIRDDLIPKKFPIQYVRLTDRISVYAVWNTIIRTTNSVYLTNANADDLVAPHCYHKLMATLDSFGETAGFAYPSWYTTSIPNLTWAEVQHRAAADGGGKPGHYNGNLERGGVGHFPLWRRSLHTRFGLFDERFRALADADWWARCWYVGHSHFRWVKEFMACYLWRSGENLWHREINENEWSLYHQQVALYRRGRLE
jgi:hypothetical protein